MGKRDPKKLFLLTYPQCEVEPQSILRFLEKTVPLKEYVIAREKHKDGNYHIHAYIRVDGEGIYLKDAPTLFRYKSEGNPDQHGNVAPITTTTRSINDVIKYCIKDDEEQKNYISNIDVDKYVVTKRKSPDYDMVKNYSTKEAFKEGLVSIDKLKAYDHARSVAVDSTPRDPSKCIGLWLCGPPGTGKSLYARIRTEGERLYNKSHNKWWCGYSGEKYVLIDDLGHQFKAWGQLKQWVDVYEISDEIKHGRTSLCYEEVIVTSNHTPRELLDLLDKTSPPHVIEMLIEAIGSRFKIVEFNSDTFTLLTGLPLQKKRSKTLNKPLCISNASFPLGSTITPLEEVLTPAPRENLVPHSPE
ncbi:Replication-associated protein [Seminavis robusta]|uniref:ATP-dependent helicase Rep n=1 Tax=Seminavis robusta TaxID=568900 RepID=A0A9N8EEX6_9STRA|nr:Replication-associated protein [Seminavis robusta]|eukprot:Sro837_g209180.1 Replication-associated protein (358) ;mRNA; f:34391-35464